MANDFQNPFEFVSPVLRYKKEFTDFQREISKFIILPKPYSTLGDERIVLYTSSRTFSHFVPYADSGETIF